MKIFNRLKDLFRRIFKEKEDNKLKFLPEEVIVKTPISRTEKLTNIDLPKDQLVPFSDEILDTTSEVSIEKLKHNLEILMKKAKETKKVDKFMLIREDNFFPTDWEWRVLSKNTNLEKIITSISYELRKVLALEQIGISPYLKIGNKRVFNPALEYKATQALSQLDNTIGTVLLPSRFRSTKHFTINTPLAVTGDYNTTITANRDFIIIDEMNAFLKSEYGYSVSYHDAYLDISHESLPISENAVVLINNENYERIMRDQMIADQLTQRRIVRYKGNEVLAINMILTEMGVLPSRVDSSYAKYDQEIFSILDNSIKSLADENGLFFDKIHSSEELKDGGHFSNYYDEKNNDYEIAVDEFLNFINQKILEQPELSAENLNITKNNSAEIVEKVGTTRLLEFIDEYNELVNNRFKIALTAFKQDRKNITPEIHKQFTETMSLINDFYKTVPQYKSMDAKFQIEESIRRFIQADTVNEQLEAAQSVRELIDDKEFDRGNGTITMKQIVSNAITQGISTEHIEKADIAEALEESKNQQMEGEVKSDR